MSSGEGAECHSSKEERWGTSPSIRRNHGGGGRKDIYAARRACGMAVRRREAAFGADGPDLEVVLMFGFSSFLLFSIFAISLCGAYQL